MARPMKRGLDYFPFDVHLDDSIKLIEAEFGLEGFGVVVKLYQKIYGGCGYYCLWNEEVGLLFSRETGVEPKRLHTIVAACAARGIFEKGLYARRGILTSRGIQKRYFEAAARRKTIEVEGAYLLVEPPPGSREVAKAPVNESNNPVNEDRNGQRKEKEKIEKQIEASLPPCEEILAYLNRKTGKSFTLTPAYRRQITRWWNKGCRLADFTRVIDCKTAEWAAPAKPGGRDMRPYLRPETLFGEKFQSYLNQQPAGLSRGPDLMSAPALTLREWEGQKKQQPTKEETGV